MGMSFSGNSFVDGAHVLVIAELAQSYEGSYSDAERLIRAAAAARADAVKFQVFSADELAVPGYEYYELYCKLELTPEQWGQLFVLARSLGLQPFADVFGIQGVQMLNALDVSGYKVHAADMCNLALLEAIGCTGRRVLLSCGGSTSGEIGEAVGILKKAGARAISLLHGFQASPTSPEDTQFLRLEALRRTFKLPVGYADHIAGDHPLARQWPLLALSAGARVIEKHLTLCRADKKEDYISALNPDEFAQMVDWIRLAQRAMGCADFDMAPAEAEYRIGSRKRAVAASALSGGTILSTEHLSLKRAPGDAGFYEVKDLVGRTLRGGVVENEVVAEGKLLPRPFRPRLVATLACRSASSRLYGKPLHRIGDMTILEHLTARIQSVPRVDQIVLAISEGIENEIFIEYAQKLGLEYVIGDEQDVQGRLILAGEKGRADLLLRATTESPFLYTANIEEMVECHIAERTALTVCEGLPEGSYCEIISLSALKDAHERGEGRHRSELCTLYMCEHPERYKTIKFQAPPPVRRPDIRLTVDYPEDLIVCRELAEKLGRDGPLFSLESIIDYLGTHPKLNAINNWIDSGTGRIWG